MGTLRYGFERRLADTFPLGPSQVCVDAWCKLDVPLAKKWGARLERTGTLAQGATHCDFRWRVEGRR